MQATIGDRELEHRSCQRCGYLVTEEKRCPECGWPSDVPYRARRRKLMWLSIAALAIAAVYFLAPVQAWWHRLYSNDVLIRQARSVPRGPAYRELVRRMVESSPIQRQELLDQMLQPAWAGVSYNASESMLCVRVGFSAIPLGLGTEHLGTVRYECEHLWIDVGNSFSWTETDARLSTSIGILEYDVSVGEPWTIAVKGHVYAGDVLIGSIDHQFSGTVKDYDWEPCVSNWMSTW